jgi:AraC-like DNA-binding protein
MSMASISNQPDEYEHWDLPLPDLPPRSILYQIRPIGIGTPETECLTSYMARLANTYHVTIGCLLLCYVIPYLRDMRTESGRGLLDSLLLTMRAANGADTLAARLVEVIEQLTLTTGAQWTTLIVWGEVFSRQHLQRRFRAWCTDCYTEQSVGGSPLYDHLIWAVAPVKVCVRHQCLLTETCPKCQKRLWPVQSRYLPGFCSYCQAWLGATGEQAALKGSGADIGDSDYELWAADQIGSLIAAAPTLCAAPDRQNVATAIKYCRDILMEGNGSILSHLLGVTNTTGPHWCQGKSVPSLSTLVRLSYLTRVPLLKLLTDPSGVRDQLSSHPIEISDGQRLSKRPPIRPNSPAWEKVLQQMEAALGESPPPSLDEVARRLGYKQADSLQIKFPDLSNQITANYRAFKKAGSPRLRAPHRLDPERQRQILEQALLEPYPESLSVLVLRMGYTRGNISFLTQKSPDLFRAVLKKRRQFQQKERKKRLRRCREIITAALVEDPPPSLQKVAERLGDKTPEFLWQNFPDDCHRITTRRTDYHSKRLEERLHCCRETIDAALAEEPPPTLEEVSARAGVISDFLRQYFADDCCRISARRADLRRRQFQEQEARLKQALQEEPPRSARQLATELGVSPSRMTRKHQEICGLIVARYKAFRRDRAKKKNIISPPSLSLEA